jgi:phenylpyruvate tautomerase PptA (4-oxalocrotonate tautomerase family)
LEVNLIHVYGLATELNPIKVRLSEVIHDAMQAILGLPADKRAHRFFPMADEDFYSPGGRSRAYTIIEIKMMQGRKPETIKSLIKRLFNDLEIHLGISPVDIEIVVLEQPAHCWGFRGITGDEAKLDYKVNV